ncbi:MAG: M23 family metallopeptidase [Deltaproteobacteria bacterium]|nr:M23 family metallopeptidase [Deltaproteobacteria bacterium]
MYRRRQQGYSLILISKDHRQIRRWEVRRWWVKASLIAAGCFGVTLGLTSWGFHHYWQGYAATETIRIQNGQYDQERAALLARLAALEESVERADRLVARLESDEKVPQKSPMTEGIGPLTEARDLPTLPALNQVRQLHLNNAMQQDEEMLSFSDAEGRLTKLGDAARRVEDRLTKVYEVRKHRDAFWSSLPTLWPIKGWITSGFGPRRANRVGGTRFHEGIDIAAPVGTVVRASGDGMVTFSGYKGGYGRSVIIDHGFGVSTLYAHGAEVMVAEGARVKRGTPIAMVGMTGRTSGPHLHYEVHVDGAPTDPLRYLAGRK